MQFLERERLASNKFLPGLDKALADIPLSELERPGSPGIEQFRQCGGPGLLVPERNSGAGASALDAVRVQRAIGARSPSLAVATTMHHFSMASLIVLSEISNGFEWMLMEGIATTSKLLASGFAEGRTDASILEPTMTAVATDTGLRISGVKKPCSLSRSMDMLTASVIVPRKDEPGEQLAVVLIPADSPGITITPFWGSFALAGAESDQITLEDVLVPYELVVRTEVPPGQRLDELQIAGFVWFELLMSASYLGAASALAERLLGKAGVPATDRMRLVGELEAAMAGLENVARQMPAAGRDQQLLADCLFVRYAVQDTIGRVVPRAVELLGGLGFMSSDDVAYLATAVNGLGFHPPARNKMADQLAGYLLGQPLAIA
ncbi:acyl-CoA dehydrogenase [Solihabitans fulvus]|uniref:Acyl-CoA dehydrogenase n=1 Tax=Solihabitans fulvus TaxID=1892852 RepID=A0A5B2WLP2_9PSEU|nr:acyl-CoA dehydrogenase family protein [Solihabitans fulvus]KAA2250947.1 acyl-CoA dehydrogenase [Solihabitans fulvus]